MTVEQSARNRLFERYAFQNWPLTHARPPVISAPTSFKTPKLLLASFKCHTRLVPHILICTTALVLMSHVHTGSPRAPHCS